MDAEFGDFSIETKGGDLILRAGSRLPLPARRYLEEYLAACRHYFRFQNSRGELYFSLYHPALNSSAGRRSLTQRLLRKFRRRRLPATATLGLTRHCQCACLHCSADYHMSGADRQLDEELWKRAVRESVDAGVCTLIFLGGEPLLRRDLERIIAVADPELAHCVAFSNGELLTAERCARLHRAGLRGVFVSIDSPQAGEHDRARCRPGLFDKARVGVQNALEAGLCVALSCYLSGERLAGGLFQDICALAREWGVQEATFFDAIPTGRLAGGRHTFLSETDRQQILCLVREERRRGGLAISAQSTMTSAQGSAFCFAANTQFYLSSTGDMCPCDFTPLSVGRFPEESIDQLWRRMTGSYPYNTRARQCRMQDACFHRDVLAQISDGAMRPYPISALTPPGMQDEARL